MFPKLKNPAVAIECAKAMDKELQNPFSVDSGDAEKEWESFRNTVYATAFEQLGLTV